MTEAPTWQADPAAAAAAPPAAATLDPELLAELVELRNERRERLVREAADAEEAAARMSGPTHLVHLADGQVVEGSQIGTHHSYGDGTGHRRGDRIVKVAACYPM